MHINFVCPEYTYLAYAGALIMNLTEKHFQLNFQQFSLLFHLAITDASFTKKLGAVCLQYLNGHCEKNGETSKFQTSASILGETFAVFSDLKQFAESVHIAPAALEAQPPVYNIGECILSALREMSTPVVEPLSLSNVNHHSEEISRKTMRKPVKIYMDGVFDLVHSGHFNAIRQASLLGDELYVGITSDEEARKAKGTYPIYTSQERVELIKGCKWVTDVIAEAPYDVSIDFLKSTGCDFAAHGDDMALNGAGVDCYSELRHAGYLKIFKRTEGISTTSLVSRLLAVVDSVQTLSEFDSAVNKPTTASRMVSSLTSQNKIQIGTDSFRHQGIDLSTVNAASTAMNQTLMSTKRLAQFMGTPRLPPFGAKIVYLDGSFDIFHAGHVTALQKAKALGDFLLVGIYDDATVRKHKGLPYPIQSMLERALCVIAMACVDEVIIGAPFVVSDFLLKEFNVAVVARGNVLDSGEPYTLVEEDKKLFERGIIKFVDSGSTLSCKTILDRILNNRFKLSTSITRRQTKEQNFYINCCTGTVRREEL